MRELRSACKKPLVFLLLGVSPAMSLFVNSTTARLAEVESIGLIMARKLDNPAGAHSKQRSRDSSGEIFRAVSNGDYLAVRRMVLAGADVNQRDLNGIPLLFYAVVNGKNSPNTVRVLLRAGADVNITDQRGNTALLHAMGPGGTVASIDALLDGGADVNLGNEAGETPLLIAVDWDWPVMVKLLLAKGADPSKATTKSNHASNIGETTLMTAAKFGRAEILSLLLKSGADPRARNAQGQTALLISLEEYKNNRYLNAYAKRSMRRTVRYLREAELEMLPR